MKWDLYKKIKKLHPKDVHFMLEHHLENVDVSHPSASLIKKKEIRIKISHTFHFRSLARHYRSPYEIRSYNSTIRLQ